MQLAVNSDDCSLLKMLLSKEEVGTRVEMHHCRTYEYKELLKKREQQLHSLLAKVEQTAPGAGQEQAAAANPRMQQPTEEQPDTAE